MKILFVTEYLPPRVSGIAERAQQYVNGYKARGHTVEVWSVSGTVGADCVMWSLPNVWNMDQRIALGSAALFTSAWNGDWDVVHVVTPLNATVWPLLAIAKMRGIRTYVSYHVNLLSYAEAYFSGPLTQYLKSPIEWSVQTAFHRYVLRFADIVGVPSESPLRDFPTRPNVVHVMKCGVNMKRFHPLEDRVTAVTPAQGDIPPQDAKLHIVYVGRLAPEKNIEFLVRAMSHHALRQATLHLVGDGPSRRELEALCEGLSLNRRIIFHGMQRDGDLVRHYQIADVCVTASESETFGFTVAESMACGTPVVLPAAGAFPEAYPMLRDKWMFKPGDIDKYADLCVRAGTQPEMRKWVRQQVQDHYSWDAAVDDMLEVYKSGKAHTS